MREAKPAIWRLPLPAPWAGLLDPEGHVLTWNAGAERIFGYKSEEAIGHPVAMLFPADLQDEAQRIMDRVSAGERVDHFDTIRIRKDGSRRHVCVTISPPSRPHR